MNRPFPSALVPGTRAALAVLAASAAGLVACSSYATRPVAAPLIAPLAPARADVATVCVFRPTALGALLTVPVRDNGQLVGVTEARTYFCWYAEPGRHHVAASGGTDAPDRTFRLAAGERLYLEHEIHVGSDALRIASRDDAARYATECDYHVVSEAPAEDGPLQPLRIVRAQSE